MAAPAVSSGARATRPRWIQLTLIGPVGSWGAPALAVRKRARKLNLLYDTGCK